MEICSCLLLIAICGCNARAPVEAKKNEAPAKIEAPVKEADLAKVHLTEAAERRLGIEVTTAERKSVPLTRMFGATVAVPQGGVISITAPLAGTLLATGADILRPGMMVKREQLLLKLAPVFVSQEEVLSTSDRLSLAKARADLAASRAEAEGQVAVVEAQLHAAKTQLDRADRLRRDKAGSQQAYEESLAAVRKAEADLEAARARLQVFTNIRLDMQPDSAPALEISAPLDGLVSAMYVRAGQEVAAGVPLVEVTATNPIWVRVPVYVGEMEAIDPARGVQVRRLGARAGSPGTAARRVQASPVGNPIAATVDLFFELPNPGLQWIPNEKVMVHIPLKQAGEALVVPWPAIVHDIHGGAWVYVKSAPQTYMRHRVEVREVVQNMALLSHGPQPETPVVTAGSAELFGTEFGAGK